MRKDKRKELVRVFKMDVSNNLLTCKKWTHDVIRGIENDRLLVLKADGIFSLDSSDEGTVQLDLRYRIPVSIKEWLPIACHSIRRQSGPLDDFDRPAIACYKSNAEEVLFPVGFSCMPPGPVAFNSAIVFNHRFRLSKKR